MYGGGVRLLPPPGLRPGPVKHYIGGGIYPGGRALMTRAVRTSLAARVKSAPLDSGGCEFSQGPNHLTHVSTHPVCLKYATIIGFTF